MKFTNDSMTDFARFMQLMVDMPVVDQTSLSGRYDFTLLRTPDVMRDTPTDAALARLSQSRGSFLRGRAANISWNRFDWLDERI